MLPGSSCQRQQSSTRWPPQSPTFGLAISCVQSRLCPDRLAGGPPGPLRQGRTKAPSGLAARRVDRRPIGFGSCGVVIFACSGSFRSAWRCGRAMAPGGPAVWMTCRPVSSFGFPQSSVHHRPIRRRVESTKILASSLPWILRRIEPWWMDSRTGGSQSLLRTVRRFGRPGGHGGMVATSGAASHTGSFQEQTSGHGGNDQLSGLPCGPLRSVAGPRQWQMGAGHVSDPGD